MLQLLHHRCLADPAPFPPLPMRDHHPPSENLLADQGPSPLHLPLVGTEAA